MFGLTLIICVPSRLILSCHRKTRHGEFPQILFRSQQHPCHVENVTSEWSWRSKNCKPCLPSSILLFPGDHREGQWVKEFIIREWSNTVSQFYMNLEINWISCFLTVPSWNCLKSVVREWVKRPNCKGLNSDWIKKRQCDFVCERERAEFTSEVE